MSVDHSNAQYARTPPKTKNPLVHSRTLSTTSNGTLFTTASLHFHPAEPLLPLLATTPRKANYDDHIPTNGHETIGRPPCEALLMIQDNSMNETEKGYWARNCRRPLKRWKWLKLGLQAILSTWAIYNTIRYFIAFSNFGDSTNQAFCLALGTSTGVSFLFTFFSFLLAIRGRNGLKNGLTLNYLSYVRTTMDYLSSFCLLGPAVVNFTLVFIFKDSVNPYLNLDYRCHLDVDLVWSVSNNLCNNKSPGWAIWLILSALRLILTLIIIIGHHIVSLCYGSRRPRAIRRFRARRSKGSSTNPAPSSFSLPHCDLNVLQTDSTLCETSTSASPRSPIRLSRPHLSSLSTDTSPIEPVTFSRSTTMEFENEHVQNEIVDHFQFILSQNSQETEEALDLAQLNHSPSPENINDIPTRDLPPSYEAGWDDFDDTRVDHINSNNIFNLPPVFPTLGYNEFGLPYPPDQNILVLNGYIRRMPTIESMGSGELGSSISASSNRARDSIATASRPPTRNTLLSRNSTEHDAFYSEPPSRTNSLSARAELLVGLSSVPNNISELGELLGKTSPVAQCLSAAVSYAECTVGDTACSSGTTESRGTSSYHTATSKSFFQPDLPLDKRSHSPLLGERNLLISDLGQPS